MAIDAVDACAVAIERSGPNAVFVWLSVVFGLFILADSVIAAAVVRKRVLSADP